MIVIMLLLIPSFAWALDITLTVAEPSSVARTAEVVTTGVPLPIGTQTTTWQLRDNTDTEIPVSIDVLPGRTPWLLVQFQSTHTSGQTKTYTLRNSAKTATLTTPLSVVEDGSSFVVTTGKIKATILKGASYKGLSKVIYDADSNGTYADPAEVIVNAPTTFSSITNEEDDLTYTADGNVTATSLEYNNAHRAVVRVDGEYKNSSTVWLTYTTRYTFYAGSTQIRVVHTLRNNLQANQRDVKLNDPLLVFGGGTASTTSSQIGDQTWINVGTSGATHHILPATVYGVSTTTNDGWVLPDWNNWTVTLYLDFETGLSGGTQTARSTAAKNQLMALAPARWFSDYGELSTTRFSTMADETATYTAWGWTGGTPPCDTTATDSNFVDWQDVHGELEADDVWQNVIMYVRTGGCRGYFNRARAWTRYYRDDFAFRTEGFEYAWDATTESPQVTRTPLTLTKTAADTTYLGGGAGHVTAGRVDWRTSFVGDHTSGWGLIDWYYLTGEKEALQAAVDLGEISEQYFLWRTNGYAIMFSGPRRPSRNLWLATRLTEAFTGTGTESKWTTLMEKISDLILNDPVSWTSYDSGVSGFYSVDKSTTDSIVGQSSPSAYDTLNTRAMDGNQTALYVQAAWRYWRLVGDTTDGLTHKDRIIKIARFVQAHVLYPSPNYANSTYATNFPTVGNVWQKYYDDTPNAYFNAAQAYFIDTLVLGAQLTGDSTMLTLARGLWSRTTKTGNGYPPPAVPADPSAVQHYMNDAFQVSGSSPRYVDNCCMHYAHRLFSGVQDVTLWSQHGGTFNLDTAGYGHYPSIAVASNNDIYIASLQHRQPNTVDGVGTYSQKVAVSKWNGTAVSQIGTPRGHTTAQGATYTDSSGGSMLVIGTTPYVAWYERNGFGWGPGIVDSCFVNSWNGSAWVELSGPRSNGSLLSSAGTGAYACHTPKLANIGGVLYVTWIEAPASTSTVNHNVVAHWNGSAWVQDGAEFKINTLADSRIIDNAIFDVAGVPHVAWSEWRRGGSQPSALVNNTGVIWVYKFTAGSWSAVGSALSTGNYVNYLSAITVGSTPYVVYQEKSATGKYNLYMKHFNGTSWVADGTSLNVDTTNGEAGKPSLTSDGTNLWLTWNESPLGVKSKVYVRSFTVASGTWSTPEGPINTDTTNGAARSPAIAISNSVPFVTWSEKHFPSSTAQIYLFGRTPGTGSAPSLSAFGSNGTAPSPVTGSWITLTPGGVAVGGVNAIGGEGFTGFDWIPTIGRAVFYEKYHTIPSANSGESQNAMLGYSYTENRWDLMEAGQGNGSEYLPGFGHSQGLSATLPDGTLFMRGNLNGSNQWHTYLYDFGAGRGKRLLPSTESPLLASADCATDTLRNQVLCMGGTSSGAVATPWLYDAATNAWTAKATGPTARNFPAIVYDAFIDRYIYFGGWFSPTWYDETWEYNPGANTWTQQFPTSHPSARYSPSFAYDSNAKVSCIVGGTTQAVPNNNSLEMWCYDGTTKEWTRKADAPTGLGDNFSIFRGNVMVYLPEHNVLLARGNYNLSTMYAFRVADSPVTTTTPSSLSGGVTISGGARLQ